MMTTKPTASTSAEIFVKAGCPYCRALKRKLEHDGTPYEEYDVEHDRSALRRMLQLNGGRRNVPTIVLQDKVLVGFQGT
jgi:glutaredoxin 3